MSKNSNLVVILTERLSFVKERNKLSKALISEMKQLKSTLINYSNICKRYEEARDKALPGKFEKTDIEALNGIIAIVEVSIKRVEKEKNGKEIEQKVAKIKSLLKNAKLLQKHGRVIDLDEPFEEFSSIHKNLQLAKSAEQVVINGLKKSLKQTVASRVMYQTMLKNFSLALAGKITFDEAEEINVDESILN